MIKIDSQPQSFAFLIMIDFVLENESNFVSMGSKILVGGCETLTYYKMKKTAGALLSDE